MARNTYDPKEIYTGDGSNLSYTFNFKIEELSQLEVIELNDEGVETQRVRGDDNTYLSSVSFSSSLGGGIVNLQANLPNNYKLIILQANDEPTQPFQFSNKLSFNLKRIEAALDFIVGAVQRLAYKSKQSIRFHDSDEIDVNGQIPQSISGQAGKALVVNDSETGFEYGSIEEPVLSADINVQGVSQGRYNSGDTILEGTLLEEIIRNMLILDTPPIFSLAGSGPKLIESGTSITPTLTPTFTQNDAGPVNNYELRRDGLLLFANPIEAAHTDVTYTLVDDSVSYEAVLDYDAGILPPGSLSSNVIIYEAVRSAFFQIGGDIVDIRSNSETLLGAVKGSKLITSGDGVTINCVFAYPDSYGDFTSLFLTNTGGNFDVSSDVVRESDQLVNDASGANPITYRVYTYSGLIPLKINDTLTFTI